MPDDTLPVIFSIVLKVPSTVFLTRIPAPSTQPQKSPVSAGPEISPSTGFSMKASTPVCSLLKSPTGFPRIAALPTIVNIVYKKFYI